MINYAFIEKSVSAFGIFEDGVNQWVFWNSLWDSGYVAPARAPRNDGQEIRWQQ